MIKRSHRSKQASRRLICLSLDVSRSIKGMISKDEYFLRLPVASKAVWWLLLRMIILSMRLGTYQYSNSSKRSSNFDSRNLLWLLVNLYYYIQVVDIKMLLLLALCWDYYRNANTSHQSRNTYKNIALLTLATLFYLLTSCKIWALLTLSELCH